VPTSITWSMTTCSMQLRTALCGWNLMMTLCGTCWQVLIERETILSWSFL